MTTFLEWWNWSQPYVTGLVWLVFFGQLWSIWNTRRYHRRWDAQEKASMERWMRDMEAVAREREEVYRMRAELTIELAKARGDLPQDFEPRIH